MEIIKLSDIIGQELSELRYCYTPETDADSDIQVSVNLVERLFNVDTIKFYSGRTSVLPSRVHHIIMLRPAAQK